jgi:hypothetical protein
MLNRITVAGLALLTACVAPETIRQSLQERAAPAIECPSDQIEVGEHTVSGIGTNSVVTSFPATGCGRSYVCEYPSWSKVARCTETGASQARSTRHLVVDRLALDTGCPPEQIAVVRESAWNRGGEQAYRMTACGKAYVCASAPGQVTSCKAALAE